MHLASLDAIVAIVENQSQPSLASLHLSSIRLKKISLNAVRSLFNLVSKNLLPQIICPKVSLILMRPTSTAARQSSLGIVFS